MRTVSNGTYLDLCGKMLLAIAMLEREHPAAATLHDFGGDRVNVLVAERGACAGYWSERCQNARPSSRQAEDESCHCTSVRRRASVALSPRETSRRGSLNALE